MRYGKERWPKSICAVMSAVLAIALVGAVPTAFADTEDATEAVPEPMLDDSAFALGHVVIECIDGKDMDESAQAPDGSEDAARASGAKDQALTMGVPQVRAYRITNQGEASYIRLSSHTRFRDLDHTNAGTVTEGEGANAASRTARLEEGGSDDAAEAGREPDDEGSDAFWSLAADGFWYRSQPLGVGEIITVHVSVEIPFEESWTKALTTGGAATVTETLDVQALQARNKVIDLDSSDPWGVGASEEQPEDTAEASEAEGGKR